MRFLEQSAISKPGWPPQSENIWYLYWFCYFTNSWNIYLIKCFEIKDKPVMFRFLGKGQEKSITSDDGTPICWPPKIHRKSWPSPSYIRSKHHSFLDCTISAAINGNWWFPFKINGLGFLQNFCPGHWFICDRNTYSSLSYASQSRPQLQLAGIHWYLFKLWST